MTTYGPENRVEVWISGLVAKNLKRKNEISWNGNKKERGTFLLSDFECEHPGVRILKY